MKILFVGDLNEQGRSFQRYRNIAALSHDVSVVSMFPIGSAESHRPTLWSRFAAKCGFPKDLTGANGKIKDALSRSVFDVVWIDKGNTIRPGTLRFVRERYPKTTLISCSEDDMYAKHNRSEYYAKGLKYYDIVFTTKTYNLAELKTLGAKRVEFFLDSYDENLHRPLELSPKDQDRYGSDVGFVGTFEGDRAEKMLYLARHGIRVRIWGNGWDKWKGKNSNLIIEGRSVDGEDYVKTINATKINLGFLRKINRDETTSRSVEIPACGGFLLAERTERHLALFEEGKEAEFFNSSKELLEKAKRYLADEKSRKRIARAGRERCLKNGYSTREQIESMFVLIRSA